MICVPVRAKKWKILFEKFLLAQKKADIVEIWFDEIEDDFLENGELENGGLENRELLNLKKLWEIKEKPILYKVQKNEDFLKDLASSDNLILKDILKNIDYLDLDYLFLVSERYLISEGLKNNKTSENPNKDKNIQSQLKLLKKIKKINPKIKQIISFHDFEKTPSDKELDEIAIQMKEWGADIVKIATRAEDFSDCLRILKLLNKIKTKNIFKRTEFTKEIATGKENLEAILIAMGREGQFSRAAGHLLGNHLMFASLSENEKTAPGQYSVDELRKLRNL